MTGGSTLLYDHDGTVVLPPGLESDAELRRIGSARKLAHVLRETREEHRDMNGRLRPSVTYDVYFVEQP